jgi:hypothetical protein
LTPAQVGTTDPAAAKLAEQLSREVGGGTSSSTTSESEGSSASGTGESEESSSAHSEAAGESTSSRSAESGSSEATPTG